MCGKTLFSSRKELRRKALKREEVRQYKKQITNDSVIYCTNYSLNPPIETISKNVGPYSAGKGTGGNPRKKMETKFKTMEVQKKGRLKLLKGRIMKKTALKANGFRAKAKASTESKRSRGNTPQNSKHSTVTKTQRKRANPRRIAGVSNEQWGHVQGLQFSLRTVNHKSLVVFDPRGQVYSSNYNCGAMQNRSTTD